jgi:hypothetical protein
VYDRHTKFKGAKVRFRLVDSISDYEFGPERDLVAGPFNLNAALVGTTKKP